MPTVLFVTQMLMIDQDIGIVDPPTSRVDLGLLFMGQLFPYERGRQTSLTLCRRQSGAGDGQLAQLTSEPSSHDELGDLSTIEDEPGRWTGAHVSDDDKY